MGVEPRPGRWRRWLSGTIALVLVVILAAIIFLIGIDLLGDYWMTERGEMGG